MQKINFKDLPSTDTPINSNNLNTLQNNVESAFKNEYNESQKDTYSCDYINNLDNMSLKCVYKKTLWGNDLTSTGISVNGDAGGKTYLVCWSTHSSTGDNTTSYIGMLRCGYSGNNYSLTEIAQSKGTTSALYVTFSVDTNGILQYQNSAPTGASRVFIYQLT